MIYFIQGEITKLIKIGKTSQKTAIPRLNSMRTGSPDKLILLGTIPGDIAEESWLHKTLAEYRDHGEWFRPEPFVMKVVEDLLLGNKKLKITTLKEIRERKQLTLSEEDIWRKV